MYVLPVYKQHKYLYMHTCILTHNCIIQGQYVFLHDAILEGYTSGDTEIVVGKLTKRMTELEAVDDEGISGFRKEFEVNNTYNYYLCIHLFDAPKVKIRIELAIFRAGYFMHFIL